MYYSGDFPNFFLPVDRVFGFEIPVTRRGKPNGSMLVTGQLKRMTPQLREELVDLLADMLVAEVTRRESSPTPCNAARCTAVHGVAAWAVPAASSAW